MINRNIGLKATLTLFKKAKIRLHSFENKVSGDDQKTLRTHALEFIFQVFQKMFISRNSMGHIEPKHHCVLEKSSGSLC